MSYLHEKAFGDAVKRLYILGSSSSRDGDTVDLGGAGGKAGSIVSGMAKKQANKLENDKKRAIMSNAIENAKKSRAIEDDYTQFENAERAQERADVQFIKDPDPFQQAKRHMQVNNAAEGAPIAGQHTRQGFRRMIKEAETQADDYNRGRAIIRGLGGTGEVY